MKPFEQLQLDESLRLYNHAVRSQLPVPNGIILLDGAWRRLLEEEVIGVNGEDVTVYGADMLLERFALHALKKTVVILPAFGCETKGTRTEVVGVPKQNYALIKGLVETWHSGRELADACRRDLLVLEQLETKRGGRALSSAEYEDDLIFCDGTAEAILLPRLWAGEPPRSAEAWQQRLQRLLIGVRRSFNLHGTEWEIEWRDDGRVCWLWGIRPMRDPMPCAEQWKAVTSASARSLFATVAPRWLAAYQKIDSTLPTRRLLWKEEAGKIWLNYSLLQDILRRWGSSTEPLKGDSAEFHPFNRYRAIRKAVVRWRLRRMIPLLNQDSADAEQSLFDCAIAIFNLIAIDPNRPIQKEWEKIAHLAYQNWTQTAQTN